MVKVVYGANYETLCKDIEEFCNDHAVKEIVSAPPVEDSDIRMFFIYH